ncbi:hypothetical protein ABVT39_001214 [Epinephelus coioides]
MKIHQILSTSPGRVQYRDITCLCLREKGVLACPCFELKEATRHNVAPEAPPEAPTEAPPEAPTEAPPEAPTEAKKNPRDGVQMSLQMNMLGGGVWSYMMITPTLVSLWLLKRTTYKSTACTGMESTNSSGFAHEET